MQSGREPLEAHRHFVKLPSKALHHAVNDAAADQRFADGGGGVPFRPMRQQIVDGHGQVMVRIEQAGRWSDDAVAVSVRVVAEGDVELVLELHQAGHRVRTGTVHADFAVVIHGHEAEARVNLRIHHRQVKAVALFDRLPVRQRRAAQRINADAHTGRADGLHVNDLAQRVDIRRDEIVGVGAVGPERSLVGQALHGGDAGAEQFIGAVLNPARHIRVRRAAIGRIVFETAVFWRVVRRGDDDAVGQAVFSPAVVCEDGVGDRRRRGEAVFALDECFNTVGSEHFEGGALGGGRDGVRVPAHKQRTADAFGPAVFADGLRDREDVRLSEGAVERCAAMAAGAETDELAGITDVRALVEIIPLQLSHIN